MPLTHVFKYALLSKIHTSFVRTVRCLQVLVLLSPHIPHTSKTQSLAMDVCKAMLLLINNMEINEV